MQEEVTQKTMALAITTSRMMLYGCTFQNILLTNFLATTWSYNPTHAVTWVVWAVPRSLATTGGIIVYFLFLQVLRCFSSLR